MGASFTLILKKKYDHWWEKYWLEKTDRATKTLLFDRNWAISLKPRRKSSPLRLVWWVLKYSFIYLFQWIRQQSFLSSIPNKTVKYWHICFNKEKKEHNYTIIQDHKHEYYHNGKINRQLIFTRCMTELRGGCGSVNSCKGVCPKLRIWFSIAWKKNKLTYTTFRGRFMVWFMLISEDPTVKCRTAIKALLFYFHLCLFCKDW